MYEKLIVVQEYHSDKTISLYLNSMKKWFYNISILEVDEKYVHFLFKVKDKFDVEHITTIDNISDISIIVNTKEKNLDILKKRIETNYNNLEYFNEHNNE